MQKLPKHHGGKRDVESLDTTPLELPAGAERPPSMSEQIAEAVHAEMQKLNEQEFDSPEEADDFEEEDPELLDMTPYEAHFEEVDESDQVDLDPDGLQKALAELIATELKKPDPPPESDDEIAQAEPSEAAGS